MHLVIVWSTPPRQNKFKIGCFGLLYTLTKKLVLMTHEDSLLEGLTIDISMVIDNNDTSLHIAKI